MKPRIIYSDMDRCEDQNTLDAIIKFCKNSDINTEGAVAEPTISIRTYDDGDQGIIIRIGAPPHNKTWSKDAYKFVGKFWKKFPQAYLYLTEGDYEIHVCTHMCDPD